MYNKIISFYCNIHRYLCITFQIHQKGQITLILNNSNQTHLYSDIIIDTDTIVTRRPFYYQILTFWTRSINIWTNLVWYRLLLSVDKNHIKLHKKRYCKRLIIIIKLFIIYNWLRHVLQLITFFFYYFLIKIYYLWCYIYY